MSEVDIEIWNNTKNQKGSKMDKIKMSKLTKWGLGHYDDEIQIICNIFMIVVCLWILISII